MVIQNPSGTLLGGFLFEGNLAGPAAHFRRQDQFHLFRLGLNKMFVDKNCSAPPRYIPFVNQSLGLFQCVFWSGLSTNVSSRRNSPALVVKFFFKICLHIWWKRITFTTRNLNDLL